MKSQQLFEIDREITQIKKAIEQRQEKAAEWNAPLVRILKPRRPADQYLSKKYADAHIEHYQSLAEGDLANAKTLLQKHLSQSRIKIRQHRNQLKELDSLYKKRNMIRLLRLKEEKEKENRKPLATASKPATPPKTDFSKTICVSSQKKFPPSEKEHSLMANIKKEKLLQILQEGRSGGNGGEGAVFLLKQQLSLGIQHTPFYAWMERHREEKPALKQKSNSKLKTDEKAGSVAFFNSMANDIKQRKEIYLRSKNNLAEDFEQRLLKVMRYQQQSVETLNL